MKDRKIVEASIQLEKDETAQVSLRNEKFDLSFRYNLIFVYDTYDMKLFQLLNTEVEDFNSFFCSTPKFDSQVCPIWLF